MANTRTIFARYFGSTRSVAPPAEVAASVEDVVATDAEARESPLSAIVFRAYPTATSPEVIQRLARHDRVVLLLLDGRRSIRDLTSLVHRDELDVARSIMRLLKAGYIEYLVQGPQPTTLPSGSPLNRTGGGETQEK